MSTVLTPAGVEKVFEEIGELLTDPSSPPEGPPDMERIMADLQKYGAEILPPSGP